MNGVGGWEWEWEQDENKIVNIVSVFVFWKTQFNLLPKGVFVWSVSMRTTANYLQMFEI